MSGSDLVDAFDVRAGAVRKRLEGLTGELHDRLGHGRALFDETVEGGAGEVALQLQKLGRALGFGEGADGVRRLLHAVATLGDQRPGRSTGRRWRRSCRLRRTRRRCRGTGRPCPRRPCANASTACSPRALASPNSFSKDCGAREGAEVGEKIVGVVLHVVRPFAWRWSSGFFARPSPCAEVLAAALRAGLATLTVSADGGLFSLRSDIRLRASTASAASFDSGRSRS